MATYAYGLFGTEYEGYYDGDPQWFSTATPTGSSEIRSGFDPVLPVPPSGFSYEWFGYFKPLSAEGQIEDNFQFNTNSDDTMYMWIGDSALPGNFTAENRILSAYGSAYSEPVPLRADTYYPVRIQWGHPVEPTYNSLYIQAYPSLREANDFTEGNLFHNSDATWSLYRGFYVRVNQMKDTGDPNINQIVFSNSSSAPVGRNRTENTNNDDFYVSGLNGANTVAVVNLYGSEYSVPIPLTDIKNFAHAYIDNVLYNGETLRTNIEDIQEAFYVNNELLVNSLPEGTLYDSFDFNEIQAVYQEPNKGAVFYFNGNYDAIDSYDNIDISIVVPGSGYQVDDEFVIPGDSLGGVTPDNDLTITVTSVVSPDGGIDNYNFSGTPNSEAVPVWFITDGDADQYDQGNYLGTDRSRCTFTGSTNADGNLSVTNVSQGQFSPVQSVYFEEYGEYGRFSSIVWQISGTPGQEGLYVTGGYNTPPANLSTRTRYANTIPYGVNQTLSASNAFGPGSTYGSMFQNSIFSMVAVNADITTFYYNGEFGADGSGEKILTPLAPPVAASEFERVAALHGGVQNFLRLRLLGQF